MNNLISKQADELVPALKKTVHQLIRQFDQISEERKKILAQLAAYVSYRLKENKSVSLNFICTHNSRRSHISQIWAKTAAYFYGIDSVKCLSGGTEATAFNPRAVTAMQEAGFMIVKIKQGDNPMYSVSYSESAETLQVFSKRYDHPVNQSDEFAAIMTCNHADDNCPFIPGAVLRLPITYDDPKNFDDTPQEAEKYQERVHQIGREMLYAFSLVKS